jgi:hypothetical protein
MSKQRKVQLTDEVWATTQERAVLEGKSASDICEHVLQHYLGLEEKPPAQITRNCQRSQSTLRLHLTADLG